MSFFSGGGRRQVMLAALDDMVARVRARGHCEIRKAVVVKPGPDRTKRAWRMRLSEHTFGAVRRTMGVDSFPLRGLQKADAAFALMAKGFFLSEPFNVKLHITKRAPFYLKLFDEFGYANCFPFRSKEGASRSPDAFVSPLALPLQITIAAFGFLFRRARNRNNI